MSFFILPYSRKLYIIPKRLIRWAPIREAATTTNGNISKKKKNDFLIGLNGIQQNVFESELILDFSKRIIKDDFKIFYENIVISRDIKTFFLFHGPMS